VPLPSSEPKSSSRSEYLSDLFSFVPSAANSDYYIDIIREKYLLRQMIMTCNRVVSDCYDHREEVDALLDRVVSFAVNSFSNAIEAGFCILFVQQTAIFAFNSFSKCALAPAPESVHQTQVFSVLLAFLSIVNGWADRFGRRGDQRVKRTKCLQFNRAANDWVTC